jgi:predicted porin
MKKHLIAAAVAGVIAAPAMAAVTLDGVVDLSIYSDNVSGAGSTTIINNSRQSTSGVSFRSSEDLGGGMKAMFRYEMNFDASEGSTAAGAPTAGEAYVGLSGGFGTIMLGTPNTATLGVVAGGTPFGTKTGGGFGDLGGTVRVDNSIMYKSPSMGGFGFSGYHSLKDSRGGEAWNEIGVSYSAGMISVGATNVKQTGTTKRNNLLAKANLGMATVSVGYTKETGSAADYKGYQVGASIPMGATTLMAGYTVKSPDAGTDSKTVGVGAKYALSKATNTYIRYVTDDNGTAADQKITILGLEHKF